MVQPLAAMVAGIVGGGRERRDVHLLLPEMEGRGQIADGRYDATPRDWAPAPRTAPR